ncbi:MAG: DMT family transporter [Rhodospirillaceae bacterium]|nr:DMT family transporter [Rhodospirillaceae bacterium]
MNPTRADNLRGAAWMLAASVGYAAVNAMVKELNGDLPPVVITFSRAVFGVLGLLPVFLVRGFEIFRTSRPGLHMLRVCGSFGNLTLGFYAFSHLPLATATALSFTQPLFMILLAAFVMGEVVRWRRGLATLAGFLGVVIMLGPSGLALNLAALAGLGAAASQAVAYGVIRHRSAEDGALTILAWFTAGLLVLSAPPALMFWKTPEGMQWLYLAFIGLVLTTVQFCLIKAFRLAEATVVNPVDYARLIFSAVLGYFLFQEVPTVWTVVGAAIIVAATLYILFREARNRLASRASP